MAVYSLVIFYPCCVKEARYADILSLIRIHRRCSPEIYISLKNVQNEKNSIVGHFGEFEILFLFLQNIITCNYVVLGA